MKRVLRLVGVVSAVALFWTSMAWGAAGACPPDKKEVESFCHRKYPNKTEQCTQEILANCEQDVHAAASAKSQAVKEAGKAMFDKGEAYSLCVRVYKGGIFGCGFWAALTW